MYFTLSGSLYFRVWFKFTKDMTYPEENIVVCSFLISRYNYETMREYLYAMNEVIMHENDRSY
jgi:hypothetical protein